MRLKLTLAGLLVKLTNLYTTTRGAQEGVCVGDITKSISAVLTINNYILTNFYKILISFRTKDTRIFLFLVEQEIFFFFFFLHTDIIRYC